MPSHAPEPIDIRAAARSDVAGAAALIAAALHDDAVVRGLIPGDHRRIERLTMLYTAVMLSGPLRHGTIDIVRRAPAGPVIGVAVWEAPGRTATGWDYLRQLPRFIRAIGPANLPRTITSLRELSQHRPRIPHWYLSDIAVHAEARGLGIGSRLLEHRLRRIDADRLPAYLEATTPHSKRLYERHGFKALPSHVVAETAATPMLREPAPRRGA